jgi:hypothetical protein
MASTAPSAAVLSARLGAGLNLVMQTANPTLVDRQLLTQQHEVDLAVVFRASLKAR